MVLPFLFSPLDLRDRAPLLISFTYSSNRQKKNTNILRVQSI